MQKSAILKKRLPELGVDGILITDMHNVRYLSGFTGSSGFLMITKSKSIFVTDFRYKEQAKGEVRGFNIKIQTVEKTEFIRKLVKTYKVRKLGFEDHNITYYTYKKLRKDNLKLKALSNTVEDLRLIKSQQELLYIKIAVKRAEDAFRKLQPFIKAGVAERKLAIKLEGLLREEGCKNLPFEVIVASGSMSALPHVRPTNRAIKKGDFVLFDWGGECNGYCSDMTRTIMIRGKNLRKQLEIYDTVLNAQERAIKTVKPGTDATKIDAAARDFIKSRGYNKYFGHGTGHGIGLAVHERPVISWQSKDIVEESMVFTIEPGIYLPYFGGVRIEDVVHVTNQGAEVLTSLPKKLQIIEG